VVRGQCRACRYRAADQYGGRDADPVFMVVFP